jgi:hypothetical protein
MFDISALSRIAPFTTERLNKGLRHFAASSAPAHNESRSVRPAVEAAVGTAHVSFESSLSPAAFDAETATYTAEPLGAGSVALVAVTVVFADALVTGEVGEL